MFKDMQLKAKHVENGKREAIRRLVRKMKEKAIEEASSSIPMRESIETPMIEEHQFYYEKADFAGYRNVSELKRLRSSNSDFFS